MRRAGASEETIAEYQKGYEDGESSEDYELWPEHVLPLEIFQACNTQWRIAPSGHIVGLDYSVLEPVFKIYKVKKKNREDVFWCIRMIESGALESFSESRDK